MAISFPLNPTIGDTHTASGKTWTWNGAQWEGVPAVVNVGIPSGETGDRPSNPAIGDQFYNGTLGVLELYTSSGWLPATGANDFNIVLSGTETSVTLDKEYFSGAYTISSALLDNTFDIYLFDTSNNSAGYSNTPSINATNNFNKIIVYGGTSGDLLSFSYKTTFTTSASTTDTFAAPYLTSISVADLPNIDDTTTITGGNFDTDIEVWFDGANGYSQQAKSVVYGSSTSVVATRPDDLLEDNAPYTIRVVNPGTTNPSGSNKNKLIDSITAGGGPVWNTAAGSIFDGTVGDNVSVALSATDPDGGAILYSIVSGSLTTGLSLNPSSGEISGTASGGSSSFIVSATDSGGNSINRSFSVGIVVATGGTVSNADGYTIHTFTGSGTFTALTDISNLEYLIVAGGGGGSGHNAAGGGAGGVRQGTTSILASSYSVVVGGPGSGAQNTLGTNGAASSAFGISATGGGRGGSVSGNPSGSATSGGSGGGGGSGQLGAIGNVNGYSPVEGYAGGDGGVVAVGVANSYRSGGGGGAGEPGFDGGSGGGHGGDGVLSSILGTPYYFGGGGGGSIYQNGSAGNGGLGGGGGGSHRNAGDDFGGGGAGLGGDGYSPGQDGQKSSGGNGGSGGVNSGGGGGGANGSSGSGGNGGSGIVIVRYPF